MKEGGAKPIIKFEVWWVTPFGITPDLDYAIAACKSRELDPNGNLIAVPVAVTEETYEVVNNRIG